MLRQTAEHSNPKDTTHETKTWSDCHQESFSSFIEAWNGLVSSVSSPERQKLSSDDLSQCSERIQQVVQGLHEENAQVQREVCVYDPAMVIFL